MAAEYFIGTSGYVYPHWKEVFYPKDLPQKDWLPYFAERLDTVEINNTFYQMPEPEKVRNWASQVPEDFCFVMKMNRIVTHRKRLIDMERMVGDFVRAVDTAADALGPILVQLPPRWKANPERLNEFLDYCPGGYRYAVEFRDADWLRDEVYRVLEDHNAAVVIHDLIEDHPHVTPADWTYLRFHGPTESGNYAHDYSPQFLSARADEIADHLNSGKDVYVYFNNDVGGNAVRNALDLKRYVEDRQS
ncbi:MAG: DUF72 domain-containing protein [Phycisphaerae bacterium]